MAELVEEGGSGCDGEGVLQGVGESEDEWVGEGGVGPEGGEAGGGGGMVVEEEGGEGGDGHGRGQGARWNASTKSSSSLLLVVWLARAPR